MSRFRTYAEIFEGKLPEDFGISKTYGSSMTIPGQGQDLAQIIASIVKLPPLEERGDYDSPAGADPDIRSMAVSTDLQALYAAELMNEAEAAKERQETRKKAKEKAQESEGEGSAPQAADDNDK